MTLDGLTMSYPLSQSFSCSLKQQETNHDQPWAANTKSPVSPRKTTGPQFSIAASRVFQWRHKIWIKPFFPQGWLVVWNMNFMTFHILGISYSHLTNIFQRGRSTTNQFGSSPSFPKMIWQSWWPKLITWMGGLP